MLSLHRGMLGMLVRCLSVDHSLLDFDKRALGYDEAPDYGHLRGFLQAVFEKHGYVYDFEYDWVDFGY